MEKKVLDIYSKGEYPSNILSNFYPNIFVFEGVECASMEGFLQSLKVKDIKKQEHICSLVGIKAKKKGKHRFLWKITGNVYWKGEKYKRKSSLFKDLVQRAYNSMYDQNKVFRKALLSAADCELKHSIGKTNPRKTILTEEEFIGCLNILIAEALDEYRIQEEAITRATTQ